MRNRWMRCLAGSNSVPKRRLATAHTRRLCLQAGDKEIVTRSEAPFRFLALLWWCASYRPEASWVTLKEVGRVLEVATHRRQMARVLAFFERAGVRLVDFETRTTGRYRLACAPDEIEFDLSDEELRRYLRLESDAGEAEARTPAAIEPGVLLGALEKILAADSLFHDGNLAQADQMLSDVPRAPVADTPWGGTLLCRQAAVALRRGDHERLRELAGVLRDDQRQGVPTDPLALLTAQLLAAKAHYDKGNLEEAERLLASLDIARCQDRFVLGRYHNLRGLVNFRRWRRGLGRDTPPPQVEAGIQDALAHYGAALNLQVAICDYQGVQAASFNLANALLTPATLGIAHPVSLSWLEQGLKALGICRQVCAHFMVGLDSAWGHVLFLETALATRRDFCELNQLTSGIFGNLETLDEAFSHTREMAVKIGNPNEIAAINALWRRYQKTGGRDSSMMLLVQ